MTAERPVVAFAPGRVNLIGDHTDYCGGYVLPMAIQLGTTVSITRGGSRVALDSDAQPQRADVPLDVGAPWSVEPAWARYVAGVVAELRPRHGAEGTVTTNLPVGAGLSSSAALQVALALALGHTGTTLELARACQRAEQRASGVPCGIMDQLASAGGIEGRALLIDCASEQVETVSMPPGCEVVAMHSGVQRSLTSTAYAERRSQCEAAAEVIGSLRSARSSDLDAMSDPVLRRRARHVVSENGRVLAFVQALRSADLRLAGALMSESHVSLRDDFEVSTPELDSLVCSLARRPAVFGARLTGAGFGGYAIALAEPGALGGGLVLRPSAGAHLIQG